MIAIESLYDAAARSGLLKRAAWGGTEVMVDFRAPDEDVLDGLGVSRNYSVRYPLSRLPSLASGDPLWISGRSYRVREISVTGDGTEARATLTQL